MLLAPCQHPATKVFHIYKHPVPYFLYRLCQVLCTLAGLSQPNIIRLYIPCTKYYFQPFNHLTMSITRNLQPVSNIKYPATSIQYQIQPTYCFLRNNVTRAHARFRTPIIKATFIKPMIGINMAETSKAPNADPIRSVP